MDFMLLNPCYAMHFLCLYQFFLLCVTICSTVCYSSAKLRYCFPLLNTISVVMYCAVQVMPLGLTELIPCSLCNLLNSFNCLNFFARYTVQSQIPAKLNAEIQFLLKKKFKHFAAYSVSFVH